VLIVARVRPAPPWWSLTSTARMTRSASPTPWT